MRVSTKVIVNYIHRGYKMISYRPLFETMKQRQITSYKLEKMGFSRATYYSIQKGNSISTNTVNQLCKLLHCSVSDIMEFIDEEDSDTDIENTDEK